MFPESLVHVKSSSGSRKWLSLGFCLREKGKAKVPDECFLSVDGNTRAPLSVRTCNWVVSGVGVHHQIEISLLVVSPIAVILNMV